ncbi:MAG TPA: hypothetical protein VKU80_17985 [Planctomycetota bacterium]|nr:hypothetical protein [Planctomycetota bacterium]
MKTMAKWLSVLVSFLAWIRSVVRKGAPRSFRFGRGILGRIFLREEDLGFLPPLDRPARSIRYLKHLGRLRRREGMVACDLGSLAKAVHRQGLQDHARRLARGAFGHWQRARDFDRRFRQAADEAVGNYAR